MGKKKGHYLCDLAGQCVGAGARRKRKLGLGVAEAGKIQASVISKGKSVPVIGQ